MVAQAPSPVPDSEVSTGEARMVAEAPPPVPDSEVSTGEARMVARAPSPVPDSEVSTGEGACRTANGELFVNAELVRQGYAKVYTVPPNVKYAKEFLELQREARENERGLWGTAGVGRPITDVRQPTFDKRRPTSDVRHPKPD